MEIMIIKYRNNNYVRILIIGLIIRLFFMPISAHSDIINFSWISHYISLGHFDVYKYLADNYPSVTYSGLVNYPPAIYFLLGFWEFVLHKIHLLNIIDWQNPYDLYNLNLNMSIFLLKIPYLICDLMAGFVIIRLVDKDQRFLAFSLWFLNPVTIFISYIMGQYDIIPTTCMIISMYFAKNGTNFLNNEQYKGLTYEVVSILFLGLAASLKNFAILLLPIYIIVLGGRKISKSIILGTFGVVPYVMFAIPFIKSPTFFNAVLNAPQNQRLFLFSLNVGSNHLIYVFFLIYFIMLFYLFYIPKDDSFEAIWMYCLTILSLLYVTILWHPQWYVWITPFSILAIIKYRDYMQYYLIQIAFFAFYIMWWGNALGADLFSPIYPYFVAGSHPGMNTLVLSKLKSMPEYISSIFKYDTLLGISFSLFTALTIIFIYSLFNNKLPFLDTQAVKINVSKKIIFMPIIIFFVIFASSIVLPGGTYIDIAQEKATENIGEIYGDRIIGQSFISEHPNLNGIEIAIENYNRLNTKDLIFHLKTSPMSNDLAVIKINCEKLFVMQYYLFAFPPIENSKDKSYYFFLESPDSSPGNAITVEYNNINVYNNGSAYLKNNLSLQGDLCFRTVSELDKYDLIRTLLRIIRENLLFFGIWFLLILILIILLIK